MHTPETRLKMRNSRLGKTHSEETKQKISVAHRNKTFSDASKKKMSIAKRGNVPWNKGLDKEHDPRMAAMAITKITKDLPAELREEAREKALEAWKLRRHLFDK